METTLRLRSAVRDITSSSCKRAKPGNRQLPSLFMTVRAVCARCGHRPRDYSMYNNPSKLARFSLRGSSRTVLHCAHRASDFPALYPYPARRLVWSPLRASNEGLLRPRVARAQRPCQLSRHSPSKLARFSLTGCRKSRSSHPPTPAATSPARPAAAKTASLPRDAPVPMQRSRIVQTLNVPKRFSEVGSPGGAFPFAKIPWNSLVSRVCKFPTKP
jgi:hypothetical protein